MAYVNYWFMLGENNAAFISMIDAISSSSNIILTDNPAFSLADFQLIFPVFAINEEDAVEPDPEKIPYIVFALFLAMANKAIKYDRYKDSWKYFMCLYIAHFLTLWIQTQSGDEGSANALRGAMPTGVATSKSVDGLSISYDLLGVSEDLEGYGTWKLTVYGQQLVTLTRIYRGAGMWING